MSSSLLLQQCSSNLDSFRDGWLAAVQLLLCRVLPPGLVQYKLSNNSKNLTKFLVRRSSNSIVANVLVCNTIVSYFKLQSC